MRRHLVQLVLVPIVPALAGLATLACAQPQETAAVRAEPAGYLSYLVQGNAAAGRATFEAMGCHSCHQVAGEGFPPPVAEPSLQVALDARLAAQRPEQIAESIVAPSHSYAAGVPAEDHLSPMGDFSEALTVRDLVDLVTWLHSLDDGRPR
jgi:mono/diheme cytochrome c family protein